MEAQDVLDVLALLHEAHVDPVLDGGWGVDALLGAQHRDHADLDLVVPLVDLDAVLAAMARVSFRVDEDHRPTRVVLVEETHGRRLDLHLVRTDADGTWTQDGARPDGTDARYPEAQLTTGWVAGRSVRCVGADLQVLHHSGYPPAPHDLHDLQLLQQTFGVALPDGYR